MKYNKSSGGGEHTSVRVIVRLSRQEVKAIRAYLKRNDEPSDDTAVREFVNSMTEYDPISSVYNDNEEESA